MDPHTLRIVSRGKTPATGRLEHLPKLWLHAPVRFELSCAAPDDTEAALAATPTYAISIHSLDASRNPVDEPLLWYAEVDSETANDGKSKGPHAIFDLSGEDIANITAAGEYWIAFHASSGGERIPRAAGYITFADDGFPDSPPTPTPPGTVYLTQAAGDSRYVRDPGTVVDNRLVRWDGTSGNQVQSSAVTVDDAGNLTTTGTLTVGSISASAGISAAALTVSSAFQGELTADDLTADRTYEFPNADGTLALTANVNGAPDRMEIYVKCAEAAGVTMGQAVYISGASGSNKLITKAIASGESTSSKTIGLVMQNLAHNGFGYVVTEGRIDVSLAAGTAVEGDPVWLSPSTAGGLVYGLANKPSAPNHMVFLGYVTRINGGTITQIYVKVQNGFELEELHNVAITSPSTGHVLTWNGTLWVNAAPSGGGGSVTITGNDGIGVAGSPGTSITLSLGNITPDNVTCAGVIAADGGLTVGTSTSKITFSVAAVSAASTVSLPEFGGNLAVVASTSGAIYSTDVTDATTVGQNILALTNPGAVTFLRMNADNTVTALSDSNMRTALGLGNVATRNVGTTTGTAAAGDDARFHSAVTLGISLESVLDISGQNLVAVTGPAADRIVFFDQSEGTWEYLTVGSGLSISGQTITASGTGDVTGPASSTANAIARFSGTGGKTLLNSSIVIDDETATTQQNVAIRNVDPATNSAVVITPKGTGAFIVGPKPDGGTTGGNARGTRAVDLQSSRALNSQVASGTDSFVSGANNTATGSRSGAYSGESNTVSATRAACLAGSQNTASAVEASVIGGQSAIANRIGMQASANGAFSSVGDAQRGVAVMRRQTTNATATDLSLDGAAPTGSTITTATNFILLNNQTCLLQVSIVARAAAGADVAGFIRNVVVSRNANAASTTITGLQIIGTDIKSAGATLWDATLVADTSNGGIIVRVTGAAATNINWVAEIRTVETIRS